MQKISNEEMKKVTGGVKIRMLIFFVNVFAFLPVIVFSQEFYFKCYFKNVRTPALYVVSEDNIFDDLLHNSVPLIKDSDSSAYIRLRPSRINFFKIGADPVLVSPGDEVQGVFGRTGFEPFDSGSINFRLRRIAKDLSGIVVNYPVGGGFSQFKSCVESLTHYIDSANSSLNMNVQSGSNSLIAIALKEYMTARLAHFLVLPILFQNDYDRDELFEMIRKNIQIRYPEYWLQIEAGRIFLHTYYRKICLPKAGFNLQKSLGDRFFASPPIRKLVTYDYFSECMEKGVVKTKEQLLNDWTQTKSKLVLSKQEQEIMQQVYTRIQRIGENISDAFGTLPLMNREGKMLSEAEKKALIAGPNIILDFWASWCAPCREKMNKRNSDRATIDGKQYRIIYISLDGNDTDWKGAVFPFLNKANSFRIVQSQNQFVEDFNIGLIPRYILIDRSALVSAEFAF